MSNVWVVLLTSFSSLPPLSHPSLPSSHPAEFSHAVPGPDPELFFLSLLSSRLLPAQDVTRVGKDAGVSFDMKAYCGEETCYVQYHVVPDYDPACRILPSGSQSLGRDSRDIDP